MATFAELVLDVYGWTNRPELVADTQQALKLAIRAAHKQGKFWRDLTETSVVTDATQEVQSINLNDNCPRMRQVALVRSGTTDKQYTEAAISDLLDWENMKKADIFWGMGAVMNIRSRAPEASYRIAYYLQPVSSTPDAIDAAGDWLLRDYQDVVTLWAAGTILGNSGEQEIKSRVDSLLAIAIADLISDNLEVTGR